MRGCLSILCVVAFASTGYAQSASETDLRAGIDFFESKIRPLLVDHCYQCHSASSENGVKGGLALDTREGWMKGGDSGPALVPGDPERSLLIKAVRYTDDELRMPPKDKRLSPEQIEALEHWVRIGAPDPRTGPQQVAATGEAVKEQAERHWAFQPVMEPRVPEVKNTAWVQTPVDAYVLSKLESKGMTPAPRADKRTLLRRVYFDLTGLPPTPDEMAAFLEDNSPEAFERVVNTLLASPRYGERWARHWLDVARYADTKGYVFEEERRFGYSYTYRDYVIRAFNEDLPFDRFLIEQIAADLLPLGEDKRPLAALGYLTLGRRFLNNQHDIIDDRIDVVTRGMMGLTVACARCHDHKYDPIPTEDYYSLYGVFASSSEPSEQPLLGGGDLPPEYDEYLKERKKREAELEEFRESKEAEALSELRQRSGEYLLVACEALKLEDSSKAEALARERKLDPGTVQRWVELLKKWKEEPHPVFAPLAAFAALPAEEFAGGSKRIILDLALGTESKVNPLVKLALAGAPPQDIKEVCERYGKLLADVDKRWQEILKLRGKPDEAAGPKEEAEGESNPRFADANLEQIRECLYGEDSPFQLSRRQLIRVFDVPTRQRLRALQRKLEELDATHPGSPPRAMALVDNERPTTPRVFIRGNPNNRGPEVPRQFLRLLAGEERRPFEHGSGRLELAQAIASRENPLTARVFVNRVWLHYFGQGLVRTPSDFGMRCETPLHRELLDDLAWRFMEGGWSVKNLHRLILLSSTYQQSSDGNPEYAEVDPNNQLLWRMNRRRLDFEAMRDSLLAVAGRLDLKTGGRAVDITTAPFTTRRTVYGFIERQNLPAVFRTFDFASPDTTSPQRFTTTVPQQALYMINSPFVVEQARHLVGRSEFVGETDIEARVRLLYQWAYQRDPDARELALAREFIRSAESLPPLEEEPPAWQYGFGEYNSSAGRVEEFHPLPHFTGRAWQGGPKLPDDEHGWVFLDARGGHPGNDARHAAIRRWVSPGEMEIEISGKLGHESEKGDGVRGCIVSSRTGELGAWEVHQRAEEIHLTLRVTRGEVIDFVVDCRSGPDSDGFTWAPVIRAKAGDSFSGSGGRTQWHAREDFSGPSEPVKPLTGWEKYAQVLLMSNELVFVD